MPYIQFNPDGTFKKEPQWFDGAIEVTEEEAHLFLTKFIRDKRAERYETEASVYDLADAETKIASGDPDLIAEGTAQKAYVLTRRLQIKQELPFPA